MAASVPNKFVGTTTQDVSSLDANFDALVNYLNSLGSSYAALTGDSTQTFNVAPGIETQAIQAAQGYPLGFLMAGTAPPPSTDLNSAPIGWCFHSSTAANIPSASVAGATFTMTIDGTAANLLQFDYGFVNPVSQPVAYRAAVSGTWRPWVIPAPPFQVGSSVNVNLQSTYVAGTSYTNTGSRAQFHYLSLSGATTFTVNFEFYLNSAWITVASASFDSGYTNTAAISIVVPPEVTWQVSALPTAWTVIQ